MQAESLIPEELRTLRQPTNPPVMPISANSSTPDWLATDILLREATALIRK